MIKWTYETTLKEAKKYKTKKDFKTNNWGAYSAASRNKWLGEFTWLASASLKKWTYDSVKEESKKYKTRSDFAKNSKYAYRLALENKWLDNFTWLIDIRFNIFTDKVDSVYSYEFKEQKSVYVGRTLIRLQTNRDYQHIFGNDSVSKFAKLNNIPVPEMKILENNLTIKEGSEREGYWVEKYKSDGWVILNKIKTGSIGLLARGKWTYEKTKEESKKYKTRAEFVKGNSSAFSAAKKNGWLDEFSWLVNGNKLRAEQRRKWTQETSRKEAMKYNTKKDFRLGSPSAYQASRENNWLNNYTWLEDLSKKWNYNTCKEEAMKYKSREEFHKNRSRAYQVSRKNNWLDEFFPKTK